jgi:hypothetical protein
MPKRSVSRNLKMVDGVGGGYQTAQLKKKPRKSGGNKKMNELNLVSRFSVQEAQKLNCKFTIYYR